MVWKGSRSIPSPVAPWDGSRRSDLGPVASRSILPAAVRLRHMLHHRRWSLWWDAVAGRQMEASIAMIAQWWDPPCGRCHPTAVSPSDLTVAAPVGLSSCGLWWSPKGNFEGSFPQIGWLLWMDCTSVVVGCNRKGSFMGFGGSLSLSLDSLPQRSDVTLMLSVWLCNGDNGILTRRM